MYNGINYIKLTASPVEGSKPGSQFRVFRNLCAKSTFKPRAVRSRKDREETYIHDCGKFRWTQCG